MARTRNGIALLFMCMTIAGMCCALVPMEESARDQPRLVLKSSRSSFTCYGDHADDSACMVENVCLDHVNDQWLAFADTAEEAAEWNQLMPLCHEHSLAGLWPFTPKLLIEDVFEESGDNKIRVEEDFSAIIRQYGEGNTYHTISDDLIPIYHLISFFAPDVAEFYGSETPEGQAIDKRIKLMFTDWIDQSSYDRSKAMELWKYFTEKPLCTAGRGQARSMECFGEDVTCFRRAVVGSPNFMRPLTSGWNKPIGPLAGGDGLVVQTRSMVDYVLTEMGLEPTTFSSLTPSRVIVGNRPMTIVSDENLSVLNSESQFRVGQCRVTVIARTRTRKILNFEELLLALERQPCVEEVRVLNEEELFAPEIVEIIRDTDVLIGAHGAGLAWGVFLPRGAAVLELVSFAGVGAQPEYFQQFSGTFNLPNFGVDYIQWENGNGTAAKRASWRCFSHKGSEEKDRAKASCRHGPLDSLVRTWGILSLSNEEIIDCLAMPIKRHSWHWGSHCLNYWRDHDNEVAITDIGDIVSGICCEDSETGASAEGA